jgi:hypothetical protein
VRVWRFAIVAVMCLLITAFWAACGGSGSGSGGGGSTAEVPASPAGKAEFANFNGVHSGEIEVTLEIDRRKKNPEELNLRILGNFLKAGEEALPQLDLAIESNGDIDGRTVEFLSGPLLRADRWVVNFDGEVYEPDQESFEELRSKLEEAQGNEGDAGNAMACIEAAEGLKVTDILHRVSYEGKGEDGAVKVETVGADLDVPAAIDKLIALGEQSPGCKAQLEAVGLPPAGQLEALEKELMQSLVAARLTFSIDRDGVVRYAKALLNVEASRGDELEVELVMRLTRINEATGLPIAHGYSPYPALLKQFGLDGQEVKQANAGEIYVGILEVLADRLFGRGTS